MTAEPSTDAETAGLDAAAFGRLAIVDPNTLELETNTRLDAKLDPHFCASIRDRGVQEPITVRCRASDGVLVVRKGQRRTLAAVRVGLTQVPVIISPEPAPEDGDEVDTGSDDYRAGQAERIVDQLVENQHRRGIGDAALRGIASAATFDMLRKRLFKEANRIVSHFGARRPRLAATRLLTWGYQACVVVPATMLG